MTNLLTLLIPTGIIPDPKDLNALDGKLLAYITHFTIPLTLLISGNHNESSQPFCH